MRSTARALDPESPLARVLDAIAVPSRGENLALVRRAQAGDDDARGELVVRNLRLVVSIAARYRPRTLGLAELVAEGVCGLLRAAETFDGRRGTAFSTYAVHWIRQRVSRVIANEDALVRLPVNVADRTPFVRASLDEPVYIGDDGVPETLADRLVSTRDEAPADVAAAAEALECLRAALQRLPARERSILALRFGLDGCEPLSLREAGKRFGIGGERTRQIEAKALARLRELHGVEAVACP